MSGFSRSGTRAVKKLLIAFWGMTFVRVQDGRIIEGWNCFDFLSMYQQVGWVTTPPLPAG